MGKFTNIEDIRRVITHRQLKLSLGELAIELNHKEAIDDFLAEKIGLWQLCTILEDELDNMPDEYFREVYGEEMVHIDETEYEDDEDLSEYGEYFDE